MLQYVYEASKAAACSPDVIVATDDERVVRGVESFGGRYRTAEDVGSTTDDMLVVSERTTHVVGLPDSVGGSGEPAGPTSIGVYEAIRATLERSTGSADIAQRRITVSGLGQVGSRLALRLAAEGAILTGTDVNPAKRDLALQLEAQWVEPGSEHLIDADVFVPAGIGGLLYVIAAAFADVASTIARCCVLCVLSIGVSGSSKPSSVCS